MKNALNDFNLFKSLEINNISENYLNFINELEINKFNKKNVISLLYSDYIFVVIKGSAY